MNDADRQQDASRSQNQPGSAQRGATQAGGAQPGGAQAGGAKPGGAQPGGAQSGGAQSGGQFGGQFGGAQAGGAQAAKTERSDQSQQRQQGDAGRPAQRDSQGGRQASAGSDKLAERGKMIMHDAQALTSSVKETAELINRAMAEQVMLRPYTTIGIAAGVGYLLGGGLATRITGLALGTAYRLGLALAARELSQRVSLPGISDPGPERLSS